MTLQSRGNRNEDDYVVDWSPSDMVEIKFKEDDDFLKIKETLTRMGVASNRDKILYQSTHILHKQGQYYINGNDTRSFCYIDDVVFITHELVKNAKNKIINVGRQEETQIEDVAKCILDIMGVDPTKLKINKGSVGSVKRRCPDTKQLQELIMFDDYTPLRKGLAKTIEALGG